MSGPAEPPVPKQTPGGSPPPYSSVEPPPPAYTAPRYASFSDSDLESDSYSASETTPIISSASSFEDKAVRRGFVRKNLDNTPRYASFSDSDLESDSYSASETTPIISSPSSFEDKAVRRGFVRKVFCLLTLQLLFTFSVVCVFTFSSVVKKAVQDNRWAYLSSFIVFIVVCLPLAYCKSFSRRHPWNIVGLVLVTLSVSYMVGAVASFHNTRVVFITMAATTVISVTIIAFSAQTRYDFTYFYGFLLVLVMDVIMLGFFSIVFHSYMANVFYGCLGALFYSLFLMIDCQLMMGTMSYRLSPEEYVNAALMIYLDIIIIFLYLLGRR